MSQEEVEKRVAMKRELRLLGVPFHHSMTNAELDILWRMGKLIERIANFEVLTK